MKTPHFLVHLPSRIALVAIALLVGASPLLVMQPASGAQITNRSLTLQQGAGGDGGSSPGGVVNHLFEFTLPASSSVGSIQFQYCETAADVGAATCVTPTGLDTTAATLGSEAGITGFTMNNTTNGSPYLARASLFNIGGSPVNVTYQIAGVTNPDYGPTVPDTNRTFFVRIITYSSLNATGSPIDNGTVAASTAEPIILSGVMPESLVFCTGETVGLDIATSTVPDCSTATDGTIAFNELFSPTTTAVSQSQMAASTNAGFGYAITVNGPTLTSGSNTIAGMNVTGPPVPGTAQFGLNLKENTIAVSDPIVGLEVSPTPNGTNYRGQASTGYDTVDQFKFTSGDTVAASDNTAPGATDAQIFTVAYIANVPGSQPAGTYTSTLTYICTATF